MKNIRYLTECHESLSSRLYLYCVLFASYLWVIAGMLIRFFSLGVRLLLAGLILFGGSYYGKPGMILFGCIYTSSFLHLSLGYLAGMLLSLGNGLDGAAGRGSNTPLVVNCSNSILQCLLIYYCCIYEW